MNRMSSVVLLKQNPIQYSIIVAYCKNYGIGYKNTLPWHFKSDLKHFYTLTTRQPDMYDNTILYKNTTIQQPIIMGSHTWNSLKQKQLKNRINIILTSKPEMYMEIYKREKNIIESIENTQIQDNVLFFNCPFKIEEYLRNNGHYHSWVIGGASIYEYYLANMDVHNIYSTYIHHDFLCDTYFPNLHTSQQQNLLSMYSKKYEMNKRILQEENTILLEYQYWKRV